MYPCSHLSDYVFIVGACIARPRATNSRPYRLKSKIKEGIVALVYKACRADYEDYRYKERLRNPDILFIRNLGVEPRCERSAGNSCRDEERKVTEREV